MKFAVLQGRIASLVCVAFLIGATPVSAEVIKVVTFVYPPLTFENGTGLSTRLVEAAFAAKGKTVQFIYTPVRRAIEVSALGDGFYLGAPFEEQSGAAMAIAPLFELQTTLLYLPKRYFFSKYQEPRKALKGRSIGLLGGYENNPLVSAYGLRVETPSDNTAALNMLANRRFDFLPCIKNIECPIIVKKAKGLGIEVAEVPFNIAPKVSVGLIYRADNVPLSQQGGDFLKGLAAIKKDGTFNRVISEAMSAN